MRRIWPSTHMMGWVSIDPTTTIEELINSLRSLHKTDVISHIEEMRDGETLMIYFRKGK